MAAFHPKSRTEEWATPAELFSGLNAEFGFTLDPCATKHNAKCKRFYTRKDNGLSKAWADERVFLNPPYGRPIAKWVEKAATCGAEVVVGLLPARTDTQWFHRFVLGRAEIRWLEGRVYFESPGFKIDRAPFPSMVVVWRKLGLVAA